MKKFIISSGILKTALHKLSPAVSKNNVLPVLSNLLVTVSEKKIELTASDAEIVIQYRCDAETDGDGFDFLLPFALINKIVSLNKDTPLTFSAEKKGIKITGPNDVYELRTLQPVEEFPKITNVSTKVSTSVDWQVIHALNKALETAGKDEVNYSKFTNVLLEMRKDKITVASTDGQFMLFNYEFPIQSPEEDDILLRPKVIKAIEGMQTATVAWNQKRFAFITETITVMVNKVAEKYPQFRAIIPQDFASNLKIERHALVSALEKCSINSDPFKRTKIELTEKGKIKFTAVDESANININVAIDAEYNGPVEQLHVNSDKMLKVLSQADEYETLQLAIHASNRPLLIRCDDDAAYLGLLVPTFTKGKE